MASKLIQTAEWMLVSPPIGRAPMFVWKPGDESPDAWRLSQTVQARWRESASRHTVDRATDLAARLFGSSAGRPSRVYERQHDLLLAEVFVRYREELPSLATFWVGEEALPKAEYGVKNPDAFLIDDELRPRRVIESAGAYSQQQVETFHEYWLNQSDKTGESWFTVTVSRSSRDKEQLKDTTTFRRDDLPIVSKAIEMAYAWIWEQSAPANPRQSSN